MANQLIAYNEKPFTQGKQDEEVAFLSLSLEGCTDTQIDFLFFDNAPELKEKFYCNRIIERICVNDPSEAGLGIVEAAFVAYGDACQKNADVEKTSWAITPTVTLNKVVGNPDLVSSITVMFDKADTCCSVAQELAFRLWGYDETNIKRLLSKGVLYISPCEAFDCDADFVFQIVRNKPFTQVFRYRGDDGQLVDNLSALNPAFVLTLSDATVINCTMANGKVTVNDAKSEATLTLLAAETNTYLATHGRWQFEITEIGSLTSDVKATGRIVISD